MLHKKTTTIVEVEGQSGLTSDLFVGDSRQFGVKINSLHAESTVLVSYEIGKLISDACGKECKIGADMRTTIFSRQALGEAASEAQMSIKCMFCSKRPQMDMSERR